MPTLNLGRVGFVNKGAYVGGTTAYKINDIVVYSNTVYACIQAHNTSHLPTDTAYWQKWTGYVASGIVNTPSGGIAATDVQSAINELDTEKQNIAPSYQGTKSVDLASASTVNIGAATGDFIHITGNTTITAFDTAVAGLKRTLVFDASLTLTHNATSLILPAGTNITTTAKDVAVFISEGSGNWRCVSYQFSSGSYALLGNNQTFTGTNTFSGTSNSFTSTLFAPNISYKNTPVSIISWSYTGTTVTLTVASHTFVAGDYIEVSGLTATTYPANGIQLVTSVTSTTIVFTLSATPTGTAGVSSATVKGYATINGRVSESIGVNQTWQDVTASRALGTTYTNTTGKPIMVSVGSHTSAGIYLMTLIATINGVAVKFSQSSDSASNTSVGGVVIIPNGATYNITSGYTLTYWIELR